jgi:hypothetical protein
MASLVSVARGIDPDFLRNLSKTLTVDDKGGEPVRRKIGVLFAVLIVSLFVTSPAAATPTPPVLVVNHNTKQCAGFIQGDDCHWCEPLEGWEILGYAREVSCPAGYEDLGFQGMTGNCRGYKNQFCCSNGTHRGDCEDLVINESEKLCAFVEEITGCSLPEGWASAAPTTEWDGLCPHWPDTYQWVLDIACLVTPEAAEPIATAYRSTATPITTTLPSLTAPPEPPVTVDVRPVVVWGAVLALSGSLAVAVWLLLRRWRR